jgi:hypothetical protein
VAAIAWRRPVAAATVAAALMLPAFWNFSQAGAIVYAALTATWLRAGRRWGWRLFVPLVAIPLTLMGIGAAVVLIAARAPTPGRRAAEAAAGWLTAIVTGGLLSAHAAAALPNADNPLVYATALARSPETLLVWMAVVGFSLLLPLARTGAGPRRVQALALWGVGFALVTVALPATLARHPEALAPAAGAAALVAILPAAAAVAAPRFRLGR